MDVPNRIIEEDGGSLEDLKDTGESFQDDEKQMTSPGFNKATLVTAAAAALISPFGGSFKDIQKSLRRIEQHPNAERSKEALLIKRDRDTARARVNLRRSARKELRRSNFKDQKRRGRR